MAGNGAGAVGVRDLKLDTDGDLFVGGGDLALVSGNEAAQQGVSIRLGFFLGEWQLDRDVGVPYFQRILVKRPNFVEVREWVRLAIIDAPDIAEVNTILLAYNSASRGLRINYRATSLTGALVSNEESVP